MRQYPVTRVAAVFADGDGYVRLRSRPLEGGETFLVALAKIVAGGSAEARLTGLYPDGEGLLVVFRIGALAETAPVGADLSAAERRAVTDALRFRGEVFSR